jgi:hypothetical protein
MAVVVLSGSRWRRPRIGHQCRRYRIASHVELPCRWGHLERGHRAAALVTNDRRFARTSRRRRLSVAMAPSMCGRRSGCAGGRLSTSSIDGWWSLR